MNGERSFASSTFGKQVETLSTAQIECQANIGEASQDSAFSKEPCYCHRIEESFKSFADKLTNGPDSLTSFTMSHELGKGVGRKCLALQLKSAEFDPAEKVQIVCNLI